MRNAQTQIFSKILKVIDVTNSFENELDLNDLGTGIYILKITEQRKYSEF